MSHLLKSSATGRARCWTLVTTAVLAVAGSGASVHAADDATEPLQALLARVGTEYDATLEASPGALASQRAHEAARVLSAALASPEAWATARAAGGLRALARLGPYIRPAKPDKMADVLVSSLQDDGVLRGLSGQDVGDLANVLKLLRVDATDRAALAERIVAMRGGVDSCDASSLAGVLAMTRFAPSAAGLRALALDRASLMLSSGLTEAAAAGDGAALQGAIALAEAACGDMKPGQQDALRDGVTTLIGGGDAVYRSVRVEDVSALSWVFYAVDVSRAAQDAFARRWLAAHPDAAKSADARTVLALMYALQDRGAGDTVVRTLAQSAYARMLQDASMLPLEGTTLRSDAIELGGKVAAAVDGATRDAIRRVLLNTYVYNANALANLQPGEVRELLKAARRLNVPDSETAGFAVQWWSRSPNSRYARPKDFQELVGALKRTTDKNAADVKQAMCEVLCRKFLCDRGYLSTASKSEIADVVRIVGLAMTMSQRRECATLYNSVVLERGGGATPDLLELGTLGKILHNAELDVEGSDHEAYAAQLVALLEGGARIRGTGHHYWEAKFLSTPLSSPKVRAMVTGLIDRSDGSVDLDAGRIAAFAYMRVSKSDDFRSLAEAHLRDTTLSADQRAAWLLLRGYIEEISTAEWGPLQGQQFIEDALQAAASPAMRRTAREWLLWRMMEAKQFAKAAEAADAFAASEQEPGRREVWSFEATRARAMGEARPGQAGTPPRELKESMIRDRLAEVEARIEALRGKAEHEPALQLLDATAEALRGAL